MSLIISYFTRYLNAELKIQPDIRYPVFRLAGYPEKSVPVSGSSLVVTLDNIMQVGITSLQDMINKQAGQKKSSLEEFRFLKVRSNFYFSFLFYNNHLLVKL
jgi:hypothetical protein